MKFLTDTRISFDEEKHIYTVDGVTVQRSVTGFVHAYAPHFDPHEAIQMMKAGRNWEAKRLEFLKDDGALMTDDEIAAKWARNGEVQRKRGTLLHFHAEQYLNGRAIEEPHSPEFSQVRDICEVFCEMNWEAFRTELSLFHCGLRIAGQADLILRDQDGSFIVFDWKRSKEIRYDSFDQLTPPLEHLPACNYWLYTLQLNTYAYIMETEYDMVVSRMVLGVVHPLRERGQLIEVPRLEKEMALLVETEISAGRASHPQSSDTRFPAN